MIADSASASVHPVFGIDADHDVVAERALRTASKFFTSWRQPRRSAILRHSTRMPNSSTARFDFRDHRADVFGHADRPLERNARLAAAADQVVERLSSAPCPCASRTAMSSTARAAGLPASRLSNISLIASMSKIDLPMSAGP